MTSLQKKSPLLFHSRPIDYRARFPKLANPVPKYLGGILSADYTDVRRFSGQGIERRLYLRGCAVRL